VGTLSVLYILNHVLLNGITVLSEKLYRVSNKMFSVSYMSSKPDFFSFQAEIPVHV